MYGGKSTCFAHDPSLGMNQSTTKQKIKPEKTSNFIVLVTRVI